MSRHALRCATLCLVAACSSPAPEPTATFPSGQVIDLSHTYDESTLYWPTAAPFRLESVAEGLTPGGYYYSANNVFTAEHGGTHLDAPVHFAAGGRTADAIPVDRFVGGAVIVDVVEAASQDADYRVTTADIERAEGEQGTIPDGAIVLIRTRFSERWPDAVRYMGTVETGEAAVPQLHFPGLHPEAADWLAANRQIKAIGIDTASIDYGQSTLFEAPRALASRDIPIFENLTNLDLLPLRGAMVVALPMKIGGGSGGPLRAIAIVPRP